VRQRRCDDAQGTSEVYERKEKPTGTGLFRAVTPAIVAALASERTGALPDMRKECGNKVCDCD
jgi:hypothetical protein